MINFIPQAINAFQIPSQTVTENQQISRKSSLRQLAPSSTKMTNDFSNKSIKQFTHLRRPTDGIPQKISFVVSGPRFSSVSTSRRLTRQITPTQPSQWVFGTGNRFRHGSLHAFNQFPFIQLPPAYRAGLTLFENDTAAVCWKNVTI